ncbi:MAG: nickel pincer cofactor biosynthesis protein LarC [Bacteroidales bacterium]|nr:nickel pincer cofactor biosynthesis protein LarC [Bacteroidales bacterium]
MRVAHFDCFSGISGDMVLGAVLDAGVPAEAIRAAFDSLGLPITLEVERVRRNGFAATLATIHAPDEETHRHLADIEAIIARSALTEKQQATARTIFHRLGTAEAAAHGMPLERVHFHEVGALDSIADILGAAVGLDLLGVERFTSRPVPPGSGTVKCAHGIMPIPAPATAHLLQGVPLTTAPARGELTTPTGAAILTTLVSEYVDTPAMTIESIGCGAGTRDPIELPNILRLMIGTATPHPAPSPASDSTSRFPQAVDTIWVIETNLDDCPPEIIGYTTERLFTAGARDVFTQPIQMKKQRPGVLLTVLADAANRDTLETILFRETGTFGMRRYPVERSTLDRESVAVDTPWGTVRAKRGQRGDFVILTPEYEDCARVARERNIPLRDVYSFLHQQNTGPSHA